MVTSWLTKDKDWEFQMPVYCFAFKALGSLHVSFFHTVESFRTNEAAVVGLTCLYFSIAVVSTVFFFFCLLLLSCFCLPVAPETSEEEGTIPPFSPNSNTNALSVSFIVLHVDIMPSVLYKSSTYFSFDSKTFLSVDLTLFSWSLCFIFYTFFMDYLFV